MKDTLIHKMNKYSTWIFDCDGVILDSNSVKINGWKYATEKFGEDVSNEICDFQRKNTGLDRFSLANIFFQSMSIKNATKEINEIVDRYSSYCRTNLTSVLETRGAISLFLELGNTKKYVVSGGNEEELHFIFKHKKIDHFFDGIYGNPRSKYSIIDSMRINGMIKEPCVYIGDSKFDYEVASSFGLDFIFMYNYTAFEEWKQFFKDKPNVRIIGNMSELLDN